MHEISKKKFLSHGKTIRQHAWWREKEHKLIRFYYLQSIVRDINKTHPRLAEPDEEANYDESTIPPLQEPVISLEALDADATDWYLRTEKKTSFNLPEGAVNKYGNSPKAVAYARWTFETESSYENQKTSEAPQTLEPRANITGESWLSISEDELEGPDLRVADVVQLVLTWSNVSQDRKKSFSN